MPLNFLVKCLSITVSELQLMTTVLCQCSLTCTAMDFEIVLLDMLNHFAVFVTNAPVSRAPATVPPWKANSYFPFPPVLTVHAQSAM